MKKFHHNEKNTHLILLATLIGFLGGHLPTQARSLTESDKNKINAYWFDGAEISRYALTQSRYGSQYQGSAEFIFVTEPFLTEKQVKHEFGPGASTSVLKLNALRTFNTGIYSYRTMLSVYNPIDIETWPHALKSTSSIQEWCGQVFQQINRKDGRWKIDLFSYFQGEGDEQLSLQGDAWLEDELWTRLRLSPQALPQGKISIIPGSVFLRFEHQPHTAHEAVATLTMDEKNGSRYTIHYPVLKRTLSIFFENKFPYVITGWKEALGKNKPVTEAKLTHRIEHSYYWSLNKPQDGKLRPQLGLSPTSK